MMNCRTIEPLIHLYRDGELSVDEHRKVDEHLKTCARCLETLQRLRLMDAALAQARQGVPELPPAGGFALDTIRRISGDTAGGGARQGRKAHVEIAVGWLRPALSSFLVAGSLLLVVQLSRDAVKLGDLEHRLQTQSEIAARQPGRQDDLRLLEEDARALISSKPAAAAMTSDPAAIFGSGLADLFRHDPEIFDELARRYPNLSSITLGDGLDDRERKILATEGRAFLKEFERLLQEGEK